MTKTRFLSTAWTGYGAREGGGRWNSVGVAMVYTSESASLTMLETLVHLQNTAILDAFTLLSIEVPDELIEWIDPQQLPENWRAADAPDALKQTGDGWVESIGSVALRVPSALSPVECNYLLNPTHPDYERIVRAAQQIPFQFDRRLSR